MSKPESHRPRMTITRHSITIAGPAGEPARTFERTLIPKRGAKPARKKAHRAAGTNHRDAETQR